MNMKKISKYLLALSISLVLAMPAVSLAQSTNSDVQAQIAVLMAQIKQLQAQIAQLQARQTNASCHDFNTNLGIGIKNDEVSIVNDFLGKEGVSTKAFSLERSSDFYRTFDEAMASSVSAFQEKYRSEILTPAGLSSGTGYLGPRTRVKLNQLYGCAPKVIISKAVTLPMVTPMEPPMPSSDTVTRTDWGISFTKGSNWFITSNTSDQLELKQISGLGNGDTINIKYINGEKITDQDAKFGDITYWYDTSAGKWVRAGRINEITGVMEPSVVDATPQFYNTYITGNFPVFLGTGRWLTYIVPLSSSFFLKFNITGSGYSQPLTDLVKSVKQTRPPVATISSIFPSSGQTGTQINIIGRGFRNLSGLPAGEAYGVWISNDSSSAQLLNSSSFIDTFKGGQIYVVNDSLIIVTIPSSGCSGTESPSCSSNFSTTLLPGTYSIYIRNTNGVSNKVPFTLTAGGVAQSAVGTCGLSISSPLSNSNVTFPLTIKGTVDNSKLASGLVSCGWQMFEGQAGNARLYFYDNNLGWNPIGATVPIQATSWMSVKSDITAALNFNNGGIGLPGGTKMKIVFTEENASGLPPVDTLELPFNFTAPQ